MHPLLLCLVDSELKLAAQLTRVFDPGIKLVTFSSKVC